MKWNDEDADKPIVLFGFMSRHPFQFVRRNSRNFISEMILPIQFRT